MEPINRHRLVHQASKKDSPDDLLRGVFVSDLHVFSGRSVGESLGCGLQSSYPHSKLLVLGGDIFDFKWSAMGGQGTLLAAEKWLLQLLEQWQGQVIFLAGNHDCSPQFLEVLCEVKSRNARFAWHDHQLQLGDCLFLHGDILDAGQHVSQLDAYRFKFHSHDVQSQISRNAYRAIVAMRLHRMAPQLRHRQVMTCRKLHRMLPQLVDSPAEIKRVFYGHTHVPVTGRDVHGIRFFNPGAAIRHIAFQPVEFALSQAALDQPTSAQ